MGFYRKGSRPRCFGCLPAVQGLQRDTVQVYWAELVQSCNAHQLDIGKQVCVTDDVRYSRGTHGLLQDRKSTSMLWVPAACAGASERGCEGALGCACAELSKKGWAAALGGDLSFSFFFLPLCCCALRLFTNCLSWLTYGATWYRQLHNKLHQVPKQMLTFQVYDESQALGDRRRCTFAAVPFAASHF